MPSEPRSPGHEAGSSRSTVTAVLAEARGDLWKALVVVLASVLPTMMALQNVVWERIRRDVLAAGIGEVTVIPVTPFDVIIGQLRLAVAVGLCLALPVVVYYGRDAVDRWPSDRTGRGRQTLFVPLCMLAFPVGAVAGYGAVGPAVVEFSLRGLGVGTEWSAMRWVEVAFGLALLFGLFAQAVTAAAYIAFPSTVASPDRR